MLTKNVCSITLSLLYYRTHSFNVFCFLFLESLKFFSFQSLQILQNVQGEIYEIDDQKLYWLDDFESHPSWYKREIIEIRLMDGTLKVEGQVMTKGDVCQCWVYFLPGYKREMLALKMLKSYASLSPDHLPYNTKFVGFYSNKLLQHHNI